MDCVLGSWLSCWLGLDVSKAGDCGFWILSQPCSLVDVFGWWRFALNHSFCVFAGIMKLGPRWVCYLKEHILSICVSCKVRSLCVVRTLTDGTAREFVGGVNARKMTDCTAGDRHKHLPKSKEAWC